MECDCEMKRRIIITGIILSLANLGFAAEEEAKTHAPVAPGALTLWYTKPATEWTEALPIGNGRLGAMVYGGIEQEHLQLNEDTLWSGGPQSYDNPNAHQHLATVRSLLEQGQYAEAEATAEKMLGGSKYQMAYQPLGDLFLRFPQGEEASDYRRELDLENAVSSVNYRVGNARFTRKVFSSHPDEAIVMRLESDKPGRITFDLFMKIPHISPPQTIGDGTLLMSGQVAPRGESKLSGSRSLIGSWAVEGLKFAAQVKVEAEGGTIKSQGEKISITDADAVTIYYSAATSYVNYQDTSGAPLERVGGYLSKIEGKTFDQLYQRHVDDHSALFNRVAIDLDGKEAESLSTDSLIQSLADGKVDPQLTELVFQYGRYLMIAGSRPGTQPLNLQGIWNNDLNPPWGSKCHGAR